MQKIHLVGDSYSQMLLREAKRILKKQRQEHAPLIRAFKRKQRLQRLQKEK